MSRFAAVRTAAIRTGVRPVSSRSFTSAARRFAEGDQQGDAFSKREKANEDLYVRQQEKAKLEALKKEIETKEKDLADAKKRAEEFGKSK